LGTFEEIFNREISETGKPMYVGVNKNGDDAILYIAEMGNKGHEAAQRKYNKALANCRHNKRKYAQVIAKIVAESILINWIGFLDDDGHEFGCDLENKVDLLTKMPKLLESVIDFASDTSNYIDEDDPLPEEVEKDSEKN
jgi:hypothetical protein